MAELTLNDFNPENFEDIDDFFSNFENIIIGKIIFDDRYFKKIYGKLDNNSLYSREGTLLLKLINDFRDKYKVRPRLQDIITGVKNEVNENELKQKIKEKIKKIISLKKIILDANTNYIIDKTEEYVKSKKTRDFILNTADKLSSNTLDYEKAFDNMKKIVLLNFDDSQGLSYDNIDERIEYYNRYEFGVKSGIPSLDKIIFPGFKPKTLNIFTAASGGGKSAIMACLVGNMLKLQYNVLVISLEMSEFEWAKRIDANILDIPMNELRTTDPLYIKNKFLSIKDNLGKLRIIEKPTGSTTPSNIESILDDLNDTEKFVPDVIVVDYLTIMKSDRIKDAGNTNIYYGSIAEDLRAVSIKYNVPIISGSQLTREGGKSELVSQADIAYAKLIFETADNVISIINNYELMERNEIILNPIKNRNTGILNKKITLKADFGKMQFIDILTINDSENNFENIELDTSLKASKELNKLSENENMQHSDVKKLTNTLSFDYNSIEKPKKKTADIDMTAVLEKLNDKFDDDIDGLDINEEF